MRIRWIVLLTGLIVGLAVACNGDSSGTNAAPTPTATPAATSIPSATVTPVPATPGPQSAVDLDVLQAEFDLNRQLWDTKGIQSYQFEYRRICFCTREFVAPVEITVQSGTIVGVNYVDRASGLVDPDILRYDTVNGLFDIIQDAIDRKAYLMSATYDPDLGYPSEVSIDYVMLTIDEELGFTAGHLREERAVSIEGRWEGVNEIAGEELSIIVDFLLTADRLSGTIDIPVQGAEGLELSEVRFDGSQAHFELDTVVGLAVWDGELDGDTISGEFAQGNASGTFRLNRGGASAEEPIDEPVPYIVEDVTIDNDDITLAGTLTIPPEEGPHPALILLTGSGPQNRNEEILGFKIFQSIADRLTRNGIAVLRWDDRGVGGSTGDLNLATLEDLAEDARAGFALLQDRKEIDAGKIGVLGHSEGGLVAILATTSPADFAFVVLMAGPAVSTADILVAQQELILEAAGATPEQIAEQKRVQQMLFQAARTDVGWDEAAEAVRQLALAEIAGLPESERAQLGDIDDFVAAIVKGQLDTVQTRAFKFFLDYDPRNDLEQLTVPVLAIYGGLDIQVPADLNVASLRPALETAGNGDFTIEVLPGANHLFQAAQLGTIEEYAVLEKEFIPGFLETITEWLQQRN